MSALDDLSDISIHAPREGGDLQHPDITFFVGISIHAPREGGDSFNDTLFHLPLYFNPRPPRGGRREYISYGIRELDISIHAPREGGDRTVARFSALVELFQSTPPARGATFF